MAVSLGPHGTHLVAFCAKTHCVWGGVLYGTAQGTAVFAAVFLLSPIISLRENKTFLYINYINFSVDWQQGPEHFTAGNDGIFGMH